MTKSEQAEVFLRAATLIEAHGLMAGVRRGSGGFCALGALGYAFDQNAYSNEPELVNACAEMLHLPIQPDRYNVDTSAPMGRVAAWSNKNADEHNAVAVIDGFRQVAQVLQEGDVPVVVWTHRDRHRVVVI